MTVKSITCLFNKICFMCADLFQPTMCFTNVNTAHVIQILGYQF